jgi:DNA-binding MarR family transcriptional regulator
MNKQSKVETLISLLKVATRIANPMRDGVADPESVTTIELRVILLLGGEGALAGHELANYMAVQPMNISRALVRLSQLGLLEIVDNTGNRRRKPYQLTPAGSLTYHNILGRMARVADFVFDGLDAKAHDQAANLLQRLDEQLKAWPEGGC